MSLAQFFWGVASAAMWALGLLSLGLAQSEASAQNGGGDTYGGSADIGVEVVLTPAQKQILAQGDDASLCLLALREAEKVGDIPRHLLMAMATAESGLPIGAADAFIPWPWAVRSGGVGYFYATKGEAVQAVEALLRHGNRNIDIGCMQINLQYHADAFSSVSEALDPVNNVAYGAGFLLALRDRHGVWSKTIAYYHSSNEQRQQKYRQRVFDLWQKINQRERSRVVEDNRVATLKRREEQKDIDARNRQRRREAQIEREQQRLRADALQVSQQPVVAKYSTQLRLEQEGRSRALTPQARVYTPPAESVGESLTVNIGGDSVEVLRVEAPSPPDAELRSLEHWLLQKLDQQGRGISFDLRIDSP